MRRHILLGTQFRGQFRHRDIRLGLDPLDQSLQVRRQFAASRRTALLCRLRRAGSRYQIGQLDGKTCTDIVASSRSTPRLPTIYFRLNTLPKVD